MALQEAGTELLNNPSLSGGMNGRENSGEARAIFSNVNFISGEEGNECLDDGWL